MKKLKITETSLRDGHQSLIATRLKTNEIIPILETMDQVGYYAMEVWGGATFDACIRFLNEDPWERLRLIRKHVKNTKLQMLLRGQNLLGYRNYADDTVEKFIELSIKNGIDIIRVFDALNDVRNLEASIKAIKKYNGHCQCAISYTTSPIHTPEYYLELIKTMESMGADSICIKDMAGVLTPYKAYDLVKRNELSYAVVADAFGLKRYTPDVEEAVDISITYEGYIKKQMEQVDKVRKLEEKILPKEWDYTQIKGISLEAQQKLNKIRPHSIGQASRISGVSPADVSVLLIQLEQYNRSK